jgi:hypothetical protein
VKDFYFDDHQWTIRYLVADTSSWLKDRQVLISPHVLGNVNRATKDVVVELSKKQIAQSPAPDSNKPVSRQFEETFYGYYGLPMYWGGPYAWGAYPYPVKDHNQWGKSPPSGKAPDAHLRSMRVVSGYHIQAIDGEVGHVEDFIIDDESWTIRYLVVSTLNWWPGKKVLVSPQWVTRVDWNDSKVSIDLSRETIKQSPEYTEASLLNRDYETGLYRHYNRPGYWVDEPVLK